ncbi:MAG TPA: amphi-Trp domain-containing protein [Chroococcales cyanobacterium]
MELKEKFVGSPVDVARKLRAIADELDTLNAIKVRGLTVLLPENVSVEVEYAEKFGDRSFDIELEW